MGAASGNTHIRADNPTGHVAIPALVRTTTIFRDAQEYQAALLARDLAPVVYVDSGRGMVSDSNGWIGFGVRLTPEILCGLCGTMLTSSRQFMRDLLGLRSHGLFVDVDGVRGLEMAIGTYNRLLDLYGHKLVGMRLLIDPKTRSIERYLHQGADRSSVRFFDGVSDWLRKFGLSFFLGDVSGSQYSFTFRDPFSLDTAFGPRLQSGYVGGDVFSGRACPYVCRCCVADDGWIFIDAKRPVGRMRKVPVDLLAPSSAPVWRKELEPVGRLRQLERAAVLANAADAEQFLSSQRDTSTKTLTFAAMMMHRRIGLPYLWCLRVCLRVFSQDRGVMLVDRSAESDAESLSQLLDVDYRPSRWEMSLGLSDAACDPRLTSIGRNKLMAAAWRLLATPRGG